MSVWRFMNAKTMNLAQNTGQTGCNLDIVSNYVQIRTCTIRIQYWDKMRIS